MIPDALLGYLTVWPTGQLQPLVSTLNSDGRVKANAAIVPAGANGSISVYVSDPTHLILDINGYFVPAGTVSALSFYPLTPCRIADTRNAVASSGGPIPHGWQHSLLPRPFDRLQRSVDSSGLFVESHGCSPCSTRLPVNLAHRRESAARFHSQHFRHRGYRKCRDCPCRDGGTVSAYASDDTDLVIDINGYFAPPNVGGLSMYTVTPCRVLDTRQLTGSAPIFGQIAVNFAGIDCALPAAAQAYVVNATVVPQSPLGYLSIWPGSERQPLVSTLNASDEAITSNMAIVPSTSGSINAFASSATHLVLDVSSYFAP